MKITTLLTTVALSLTVTGITFAEVKVQHAELTITLSAEPTRETETIEGQNGAEPKLQHQLIVNQPNGSIIVWYQNADVGTNPQQALIAARDAIVKVAGGNLSEDKEFQIEGHPGRYFIVSIPQKKGEFRVAYVYANGRFYQILAVGTPDFTRSESTNEMFKSVSFKTE